MGNRFIDPQDAGEENSRRLQDQLHEAVLSTAGGDVELMKLQSDNVALRKRAEEAEGRFAAPIVCICGSTRFKQAWVDENKRLTLKGLIVLSVGLWGHCEEKPLTDDTKQALDSLHKRKIDLADWVWVLDVGGYIGESTRSEIAYATMLGKPVRYLSHESPDYTEPVDPVLADNAKLRAEVENLCTAFRAKMKEGITEIEITHADIEKMVDDYFNNTSEEEQERDREEAERDTLLGLNEILGVGISEEDAKSMALVCAQRENEDLRSEIARLTKVAVERQEAKTIDPRCETLLTNLRNRGQTGLDLSPGDSLCLEAAEMITKLLAEIECMKPVLELLLRRHECSEIEDCKDCPDRGDKCAEIYSDAIIKSYTYNIKMAARK